MSKEVRVIARPQDPLMMDRLVRLLIAQAQLELMKRQARAAGRQLAATGEQEPGA